VCSAPLFSPFAEPSNVVTAFGLLLAKQTLTSERRGESGEREVLPKDIGSA